MAINYIIGGLQSTSFVINVLALGAFLISPGLRTTANRFTINLLVANLIACLALTPALWLNGGLKTGFRINHNAIMQNDRSHFGDMKAAEQISLLHEIELTDRSELKAISRNEHRNVYHDRNYHTKYERDVHQDVFGEENAFLEDSTFKESIEALVINRDENGFIQKFIQKQLIDDRRDDAIPDEIEIIEEFSGEPKKFINDQGVRIKSYSIVKQSSSDFIKPYKIFSANALIFDCSRFWGFDLAATIGVLSVLLVVGDTWCAVTDPLRYHSKISYLKSWLLISSVWIVGIFFTALSALRTSWCVIEMEDIDDSNTTKKLFKRFMNSSGLDNIYVIVFSFVFFSIVIMIPFILTCFMYWNIFSEARQSSQRMRRNGSSPLLQSSLNLQNSSANTISLNESQRYPSLFDVATADALTMKIDDKRPAIDESKSSEQHKKHSDQPIGIHKFRNFLDIPIIEEQTSHATERERIKSNKSLTNLKPKWISQFRQNISIKQLDSSKQSYNAYRIPPYSVKNPSFGRMITGEIRQVQSSPNFQKLSNSDLLHKIPNSLNNRSTVNINQTALQASNSPRALSYMISIRHRLSNASSIFKYREESRAARIGFLVVAMFMLSYLPYGLLILFQGRLTFISNASMCSILCLLFANMSSPFIFAYRNRRVRRAICRLFGVELKSNHLHKQRLQLRKSQAIGVNNNNNNNNNDNKHVRIHRNLSVSNFSLNMLPHKIASHSMLSINQCEQYLSVSNTGSVLVPIDDVETGMNECKIQAKKSNETPKKITQKIKSDIIDNNVDQMKEECLEGSNMSVISNITEKREQSKSINEKCTETKDISI